MEGGKGGLQICEIRTSSELLRFILGLAITRPRMIVLRTERGKRSKIGRGSVRVFPPCSNAILRPNDCVPFSSLTTNHQNLLLFSLPRHEIHPHSDNPHHRMRKFLESKSWWSEAEEEALKAAQKKAVMSAFQAAEKLPKPSLRHMFDDVYDEQPWNLVRWIPSKDIHAWPPPRD